MERERKYRIKAMHMYNLRCLFVCLVKGEQIECRMHGLSIPVTWSRGWMKGVMKVFSDSLAIMKEWRIVRLLKEQKRDDVWEIVQWVDRDKVE